MRVPHISIFRNAVLACSLAFAFATSRADTTTVSFDSGSQLIMDQNTGASNALSGGGAGDGNGDVLQLGYYSAATLVNNFAGTWVPLSGQTSLNTAIVPGSNPSEPYNATSIGDLTVNGAADGSFALSLNFVAGSPTSGNSFPAAGVPLALRFYNGTSIANSTFYNVVSDDLWVWKTPVTPPTNVTISLDDLGLEWQSIALGQAANTAFHTTIPITAVPEPSTWVAGALVAATLAAVARRRVRA